MLRGDDLLNSFEAVPLLVQAYDLVLVRVPVDSHGGDSGVDARVGFWMNPRYESANEDRK